MLEEYKKIKIKLEPIDHPLVPSTSLQQERHTSDKERNADQNIAQRDAANDSDDSDAEENDDEDESSSDGEESALTRSDSNFRSLIRGQRNVARQNIKTRLVPRAESDEDGWESDEEDEEGSKFYDEESDGSVAERRPPPEDDSDDEYIDDSESDEGAGEPDANSPHPLSQFYTQDGDNADLAEISQRTRELFSTDDESSNYESDVGLDEIDAQAEQGSSADDNERRPKKKKSRAVPMSTINENGRVFLNLAQKEYDAGNHEDAILLIEESIMEDPKSRLPYILLDVIHTDLGNTEAALNAKILAASAGSIFPEDWEDVANRSMEQGLYSQAITFYQRAIGLAPDETSYRLRIAEAYVLVGNYRRAISAMKRLHEKAPANPLYTSELAKLYLNNNMVQAAVTLYEDILIANMESSTLDLGKVQPFGWSELNVLCELYDKQKVWMKGIRTIKRVSRWLLDRVEEVWWADLKDDSEFDSRRFKLRKFSKSNFANDESKFEIPLDIRCKLLIFRLEVQDIDEAMVHLEYLFKADRETYPDLIWEAGNRFMKFHKYNIAFDLFSMLVDDDTEIPSELLYAIGKCEMELGNWKHARTHLKMIIEVDPNNIEALVGLGEACYALDDVKAAKEYVTILRNILRKQRKQDDAGVEATQTNPIGSALIEQVIRPRKTNVLSPKEKKALQAKLRDEVQQLYAELQRHWQFIVENKQNLAAVIRWRHIAYQLVGQVLSVKSFTYGKKVHLTFHTEEVDEGDLEDRLNLLTNKLVQNDIEKDEDEDYDEDESSDDDGLEELDSEPTKKRSEEDAANKHRDITKLMIRGLTVPQWFAIFMQLALVLAIYNEDPTDSYKIIDAARNIKLLREYDTSDLINIVNLSCVYHANDPKVAVELVRYFSLAHIYTNDAYRLHYAILGTGAKSCEVFKSQAIQKYYMRRIHLLESQAEEKPSSAHPYTIVAFIYVANRSYTVALDYFYKALEIVPKDSLILLGIGMSHILRALNRLSMNRHIQILQGFSYLMKYHDARKQEGEHFIAKKKEKPVNIKTEDGDIDMEQVETESSPESLSPTVDATNWEAQEASYNMGRSFHALGLNTEASSWYEKALADYPDVVPSESDRADQHESIRDEVQVNPDAARFTLKPNAAYNLIQIYSTSGNVKLAREIADKYLVI